MKKNIFILIQGRPATGKTTLGKKISDSLDIPFFSRDDFKEIIYDTLGEYNDNTVDWSRHIGALSFELLYKTIENILHSDNSCIAETAWIPEFAEPKLNDILSKTNTKCLQIYLYSDNKIRKKRFEKRATTTRHAAHMDTMRLTQGLTTNEDKHPILDIPSKLIEIDTTNFKNFDPEDLIKNIHNELS